MANNLIPISSLHDGESAEIITINGGRSVKLRMSELGFNLGVILRVIRNVGGGPIMIELKAGKIALGRGVAQKIFCKRLLEE